MKKETKKFEKKRRGARKVHPDLIFEKAYDLARQTQLDPLTKKTSKSVAKLTAELFLIMRKVNELDSDFYPNEEEVEDLIDDISGAIDED